MINCGCDAYLYLFVLSGQFAPTCSRNPLLYRQTAFIMGSFLDCADGCHLTIEDLHTKISFATPSDALLGALFIKYANATMEYFDDLLSLFQHPAFEPSRITLRRTEDIVNHISYQRELNVNVREMKETEIKQRSQLVPVLVVDLVAQLFESERTPFHRVVTKRIHDCEIDRTLCTMSVVHRSWTYVAQRALRRRIIAAGPTNMRLLLLSPHLGPWVRDLCIKASPLYPEDSYYENVQDAPRLIGLILSKCPATKNLYLEDFLRRSFTLDRSFTSPSDNFRAYIHGISELPCLEHLWLYQFLDVEPQQLNALINAILHLQRLKGLKISQWMRTPSLFDNEELALVRSRMDMMHPNATLQNLSLQTIICEDLWHWLLKFSDTYRPHTLELSLKDIRHLETDERTRPLLEQLGPHVMKLMLTEYQRRADVSDVVSHFPALQSFCLCLDAYVSLPSILFPASLHRLHLHFLADTPVDLDQKLVSLLRNAPHIRRLLITYETPDPGDLERDLREPILTLTSDYCSHNAVEFTMEGLNGSPSYLDL